MGFKAEKFGSWDIRETERILGCRPKFSPFMWQTRKLRPTEGKGGVQEREGLEDWVLVFGEIQVNKERPWAGRNLFVIRSGF